MGERIGVMGWKLCLLAGTCSLALACGGDDSPSDGGAGPDGGALDGGDADGGQGLDCSGMSDGTVCAEGSICLGESCEPSRCGDNYVDEATAEQCDDGNDVPGDGCEPGTCTYSCDSHADCDDGFPCNGLEECNPSLHRCAAGTPQDGVACRAEGGDEGVCSTGTCAPPGCGNDVVDGAEECDDGRDGDNDDGCRDDCTFTCESDDDCSDSNMCTGAETCDLETHTCQDGTPLDCDDSDICTSDRCDMTMGCVNTFFDMDGDGYAPATTCTTSGLEGGDCHDGNEDVHPGQTAWFAEGYCPESMPGCSEAQKRFDFNCDGITELEIPVRPATDPCNCAMQGDVFYKHDEPIPECGGSPTSFLWVCSTNTDTSCSGFWQRPRSGFEVRCH